MSGSIPPLPKFTFMAWWSVKKSTGTTLPLPYINIYTYIYKQTLEFVSRSFRTGRLERELQIVQLSNIRCNCIGILWVIVVSFAAITLCVASQRVFIFVIYFVMTQSGNFWIQPCIWEIQVSFVPYTRGSGSILTDAFLFFSDPSR
jgi:hypothetical protein